eukprot:CAMPEP_0172846892 /NCGR_PEP_ID=MMETSP1075-20121228/39079_1 /TAXON_ID=2916 /ORGANISM="Ceratium fusus, Strain PA161109" /LENGTH=66 /DNA_ID=CAMNT_0013691811 /DNA_START=92 /DNA_END=288 /DNA_ORIENTATION=-
MIQANVSSLRGMGQCPTMIGARKPPPNAARAVEMSAFAQYIPATCSRTSCPTFNMKPKTVSSQITP